MFPIYLIRGISHYLIFFLSTVLLSSCAFRADLTLYQGERWEFVSVIELTHQEENGIVGAGVRTSVAEWEYEARPEGITIGSEREETANNVRYVLKAEGKGYDLLQQELVSNGWPGQVELQPDGAVYLSLPAPGDMYSLVRNDFYLHAGKIIETNAPRIEGNTAVWTSSDVSVRGISQMEAIVRPKSHLDVRLLIGAGAIVVMLIGGVIMLTRRKQPESAVELDSDW